MLSFLKVHMYIHYICYLWPGKTYPFHMLYTVVTYAAYVLYELPWSPLEIVTLSLGDFAIYSYILYIFNIFYIWSVFVNREGWRGFIQKKKKLRTTAYRLHMHYIQNTYRTYSPFSINKPCSYSQRYCDQPAVFYYVDSGFHDAIERFAFSTSLYG